jgi:hypothetical protein
MPQTSHPNPLGPLNPVSDSEATRLVTPEARARLLTEIMATPDEARTHAVMLGLPFARAPRGRRRLVLVVSGITAAIAMVLVLPGLFAGSDSATEPSAAQAQLLAHISAALSPPGTIVIEDESVHDVAGGYTQRADTYTIENITETSARGQQGRTFVTGSFMRPGYQNVWTSNWEAIYDPTDKTIYTGAENNGGPAFIPGDTSVFKQELDKHLYRLDGTSIVNGRAALKLVPVQAALRRAGDAVDVSPTVYVSPKTYYPIRLVTPAPPGAKVPIAEVANWLTYQLLPATAANQRLVSLSARHPRAHLIESAVAMQRVYRHEHLN